MQVATQMAHAWLAVLKAQGTARTRPGGGSQTATMLVQMVAAQFSGAIKGKLPWQWLKLPSAFIV